MSSEIQATGDGGASAAPSTYVEWKDWQPEAFGTFNRVDARYFAAETALEHVATPRVLEMGFGNGSFLGWAKSVGAEVWGVEISPTLVDRAAALLGVERALSDIYDHRFDALAGTFTHIVAFDVIEHIPQEALSTLLRRMRALLRADGRIVLRFPNGDSPFGRFIQHGDPTHLTTLGSGKIQYLARITGLRTTVLRAPALPITGVGLVRGTRRCLVLVGRSLVERMTGVLYFGGIPVPLDPNYTAVLMRDDDRPVPRAGRPRAEGQ